jgi:RNA polymerase sigma-70 factor (ECF subfamily)
LVCRVLRGERDLFGEIVQRHYDKAYGICYAVTANREDSNDLVQEVFTNCFIRLDQIKEPRKLAHYIAKSAKNRAINLVRQRRAAQRLQMNMLIRITDQFQIEPSLPADSEEPDLREAVRRKIEALPRKSREVICLYYFDRLPTRGISELLRVNEAVVRKRLEYGRNALKAALEREIEPAIQTDEERRERIAIIVSTLPLTVPEWKSAQPGASANDGVRRRKALTATAIGVGAVVITSAIVYFSIEVVRSRIYDDTLPAAPARPDSRDITEGQPATPVEPSSLSQPVEAAEDPPRRALPSQSPLRVVVGPPPYAANPSILQFLETVASDFAADVGVDVAINIGNGQVSNRMGAFSPGELGDLMMFESGESGNLELFARLIAEGSLVRLNELA